MRSAGANGTGQDVSSFKTNQKNGYRFQSLEKTQTSIHDACSMFWSLTSDWFTTLVPSSMHMSSLRIVFREFGKRVFSTFDVLETIRSECHGSTKEVSAESKGYTFHECKLHANCAGERYCVRSDLDGACDKRENCYCLAEDTQLCSSSNECKDYPHELCLQLATFIELNDAGEQKEVNGICGSRTTIDERLMVEVGPTSTKPDATNEEITAEPTEAASWSLSPEAPSPHVEPTEVVPEEPIASPVVDQKPRPSASSSKPSENDEAACVDALLLQRSGLSQSQLVFRQHRVAVALCDKYGSCATPGHIVIYHGHPMSMKTYCETQSEKQPRCETRKMLVNSPRFAISLRLNTNTSDLQFTALSARFETKLEEVALTLAIRIGV